MNAVVNNNCDRETVSVARENNDLHHSYFEPLYDAYGIKKNVAPMLKRKKKSLPNANSNDLHTAQLTTKCTLRTIQILLQQKYRMGSKYDSFCFSWPA